MYTMSSASTIRVKQSDFGILYDLTSDFVVWSYTIRSLWCFLFQNEFWKSSSPSPRVYGIFDLKLNFGKVVPLLPPFWDQRWGVQEVVEGGWTPTPLCVLFAPSSDTLCSITPSGPRPLLPNFSLKSNLIFPF